MLGSGRRRIRGTQTRRQPLGRDKEEGGRIGDRRRRRGRGWANTASYSADSVRLAATWTTEQEKDTEERKAAGDECSGISNKKSIDCSTKAMALASRVVLVRGEQLVSCATAAGEWLGAAQRGAYTTARTVGVRNVFEFETHVTRLAESARLMMADDAEKDGNNVSNVQDKYRDLTDPVLLREKVVSALRVGMSSFLETEKQSGIGSSETGGGLDINQGEMKITLLATWPEAQSLSEHANADTVTQTNNGNVLGTTEGDLYCHISSLGGRPNPPVKVILKGAPRENAVAKDSEWVRQRQELVKEKPDDVNEVVLAAENGDILEGTTSNFFVVIDGEDGKSFTVQTAGGGKVLEGTVRKLVIGICEKEAIKIDYSPPSLNEIDKW